MFDHAHAKMYGMNTRLLFMTAIAILLFLGSMLMGQLVPELLLVRAFIVMPFILFLPGFLALRALGIRLQSATQSIVMALGLSIAMVMLVGFAANFILPHLGVPDPISVIPMTFLIVALVVILAIVASSRNDGMAQFFPKIDVKITPYYLFLALVPIVTLLGVALQICYSINVGLVIALSFICLIAVLAGFGKIPREAYPLTIFVVGLSILFHTIFFSEFLWGWDIHKEYYSATAVVETSVWSPIRWSNVNAMLSITILGPVLSILSGADVESVLRIVYPFIFAFVPMGLYLLFKRQTNEDIAFFASFFIISIVTFFMELPQLARQEVAELFVVLLLLLIVDVEIERNTKVGLFILFSFSLIVSHYATYYFFIAILLSGYVLDIVLRKWRLLRGRDDVGPLGQERAVGSGASAFLTPGLLLLILFFSLAWYTFCSSSSPISSVIDLVLKMFNSILDIISNSAATEGTSVISEQSDTILHELWKYSQLVFAAAIVVGAYFIIKGMKNRQNWMQNDALTPFNIAALGVLCGCLVLPHIASSLNTGRVYHLALLFLAPVLVLGVIKALERIVQLSRSTRHLAKHTLKAVSTVLLVSLLFNTGLIYELTGDSSTSFALDENFDFPLFTDAEVTGVQWTVKMGPERVMADEYRIPLFFSFSLILPPFHIPDSGEGIRDNTVIYLGKYNLDHRVIHSGSDISWNDAGMPQLQYITSKVYASPVSEVWYYTEA